MDGEAECDGAGDDSVSVEEGEGQDDKEADDRVGVASRRDDDGHRVEEPEGHPPDGGEPRLRRPEDPGEEDGDVMLHTLKRTLPNLSITRTSGRKSSARSGV